MNAFFRINITGRTIIISMSKVRKLQQLERSELKSLVCLVQEVGV